jgi:hypothetical protein
MPFQPMAKREPVLGGEALPTRHPSLISILAG